MTAYDAIITVIEKKLSEKDCVKKMIFRAYENRLIDGIEYELLMVHAYAWL